MHRILFLILVLFWSACCSNSDSHYIILDNGNLMTLLDSMEYVWIPAGKTSINKRIEKDGQKKILFTEIIFLEGFWMSKTEVTVKQFQLFTESTNYITEAEKDGHRFNWLQPGFEQKTNNPVVYVSLNDSKEYLSWTGAQLPSQEEWIYALKAGSSDKYYWGNEFDDRYVWYRKNAAAGTKPVGIKLPNSLALHDMIGNVYEYATVCNSSYRTLGASWTRCNDYYSHIPGDTVHLDIGQLDKFTLENCSAQLINPYNDDTGFRSVLRQAD